MRRRTWRLPAAFCEKISAESRRATFPPSYRRPSMDSDVTTSKLHVPVATNNRGSLLYELQAQYEAVRDSTDDRGDVESYQAIDKRLRDAFRWLERAITYLNGIKPSIDHRFDLGYGFAFDSPRFAHGSVGQHERRIRRLSGARRDQRLLRDFGIQAAVDRGRPGMGVVCREDAWMRSGCSTITAASKNLTARCAKASFQSRL